MSATIFNWQPYAKNPDLIPKAELAQVVAGLKSGALVIFPTDTVYGLACNCFDEAAISRLFEIKHRPLTNPINILTDSIAKIHQSTSRATSPLQKQKVDALISDFLPGPLTLVLDKSQSIPDLLTANLPTIGVRIPDDPLALKLLSSIDFPLATTSTNLSGEQPGTQLTDFLDYFHDKVDFIIDGGPSKLQTASTVVRVEPDGTLTTLRQGSLKLT